MRISVELVQSATKIWVCSWLACWAWWCFGD